MYPPTFFEEFSFYPATCNSGGSGFRGWWFQDGWYFENSPHEAHWGILERGYATGSTAAEKPLVNTFRNYSLPAAVSACGPSPVSTSSLQTYNPALTYFNPFQHPANPQNTIKGYVYDQDGNPVANAYVGGHTMTFYDPLISVERHPYYRIFTDENGFFEIIPEPFDLNSPPHTLLGELHTLFITTSGGDRLKYSAFWPPVNASNVMPLTNSIHSWMLNRIHFAYDGVIDNILVPTGESRNLEARNTLTISDVSIQSGSAVNIRAKEKIHVNGDFHATSGSLTHIYCENTSINCSGYNGYTMEYKMPGSVISHENSKSSFINLEFKNDKNSPGTFTVFPNPAISAFKIRSEKPGRANMTLKNLVGQEIAAFAFSTESEPIDVSNLARGVYFIIEEKTGGVKKLIVQ